MIQIFCRNTSETKSFIEGTTLQEMLPSFGVESRYPIISARVNNVSQGLKFKAYNNREVEFLDYTSDSGRRVYFRSLCFLLVKAAKECFPEAKIYIEHEISGGYFVNLIKDDRSKLKQSDVKTIKDRMRRMVEENIAFHRREVQLEDSINLFKSMGYDDKVKLLETSEEVYMDYYLLGDTPDYYYGRLVPSTSFLQVWDLEKFHSGMLLRVPDKMNPEILTPFVEQKKTFAMLGESLKWNIIMRLNNTGDVNRACLGGDAGELIQVAEALQEKKIVAIAEEIDSRARRNENPIKIVLITGPSSSGKSTFCKRLSIQLKACGLRPVSFSTDDYFVNRVETPKFPDGSYDFDNFDTVDHDLLQKDVLRLLGGEEVQVPSYNFVTGKREYGKKKLKLTQGSVLLIEGIHALNPRLTDMIPGQRKFKIFISTLTSTSLDNHNVIPSSDNRLLRRIIRDARSGAFTPRETIAQWPNVVAAEEKWIYPYQEEADVMFNSAYLVEFAVLRNYAEPMLRSVPKNCPEYTEAHRLLKFIHYFVPVSDEDIPATSLLRSFIGGSSFKH